VKVSGKTRILAIFGDPVAHSLSPLMQNRALTQAGIDAVYVPCHVPAARIGAAVDAIRSLDFLGVNLTVPLKELVCPLLDDLDESARLIGAVNTVVNRSGRLTGYNTDADGFLASVREDLRFDPRGRRILLLGAGGACRAAVVALCRAGAAQVSIANRTVSRAARLVDDFAAHFPETSLAAVSLDPVALEGALRDSELLVNTTSIGLKGEGFETFPWAAVPVGAPVFDMVYSASVTPFVAGARRHGHPATGGLGMLAGQGEKAFELWTGQPAPAGVMRASLEGGGAD